MISVRLSPLVPSPFALQRAPVSSAHAEHAASEVAAAVFAPVRTILTSSGPTPTLAPPGGPTLTLAPPSSTGVSVQGGNPALAAAAAQDAASLRESLAANARRTLGLGSGMRFVVGESTPTAIGTQVALANLGYAVAVDGVWGPGSQRALDAFRREHGLSPGSGPQVSDAPALIDAYEAAVERRERVRVSQRAASTLRMGRRGPLTLDGIMGPATERAIGEARDRAPPTLGLQLALHALGYEVGVDGQLGPQTRAALQRFRDDTGLEGTGGAATVADARALFDALEARYLEDSAGNLEVHHNFFGVEGRVATGVRLETLRELDAQFRSLHQRQDGGLLSRHYTVDELFGTGANSRPSLESLGRFGAHTELLRLLDRATDVYRDVREDPEATLHAVGNKEILSVDRGYPSRRHMDGWAVDVGEHGGMSAADRHELVEVFLRAGATSIGVYGWGVHADVDPSKLYSRWTGSGASGASLSLLADYWGQ